MRFEYESPEKWSIYSDGKTYTEYHSEIAQATQKPIGKADDERLQVFQILGTGDMLWKDQFKEWDEPRDAPMVAGHRMIRLIPKRKDVPPVLMEVDERTFLIHRFVLEYTDGERSEFRFRNIRTDKLDNSVFEFKPPSKVEVIIQK